MTINRFGNYTGKKKHAFYVSIANLIKSVHIDFCRLQKAPFFPTQILIIISNLPMVILRVWVTCGYQDGDPVH